MILTKEQQAILDGEKGETLAKVMKTLVMYGDAFEAEKLVPITSKYNHLVTSFGLKVMSPVYDLMQQILEKAERTHPPADQAPEKSSQGSQHAEHVKRDPECRISHDRLQ